MLARLDSGLEFEAGTAGRAERHRTLRDTISWSYDLPGPAAPRVTLNFTLRW